MAPTRRRTVVTNPCTLFTLLGAGTSSIAVAIAVSALLACAPKESPQLSMDLDESFMLRIEAHVGPGRLRQEMEQTLPNAIAEAGWGGESRVVGKAGVAVAGWETRIGEVIAALKELRSGKLTVTGSKVELRGQAPASAINAVEPALKRIFGPAYEVKVDLVAIADDATPKAIVAAGSAPEAERPEPASAQGTASGWVRTIEFADLDQYRAFERDRSEINRKKASKRRDVPVQAALAYWQASRRVLVVHLYAEPLTAREVETFRSAAAAGDNDAVRAFIVDPRNLAVIVLVFSPDRPLDNQGLWGDPTVQLAPARLSVSSHTKGVSANFSGWLPANAGWATPGRILPAITLRTEGQQYFHAGEGEWSLNVSVPVIYTTGS